MALSLLALTQSNTVVTHSSGRQYAASSTGFLTIPGTDAVYLQADSLMFPGGFNAAAFRSAPGAVIVPLCWTGATADRPVVAIANTTALASAPSNQPPAALGMPFYDTTLSAMVFFTGTAGVWINTLGASV